jgi:predicted small lipoprotein YifL
MRATQATTDKAMKTAKIALFLLLNLSLASCGQTGPLYLPSKPSPVVPTPKPPATDLQKTN